jgi:predicted acetyltransferase
MTASYPIRPATESELPAFSAVGLQAFNSSWPLDKLLELDRFVFEPERSLAAFDGDQVVGTAIAHTFGITVPSGSVPAAGVSAVSVLPSHRRRGILSALMRRQLDDLAQGPEPVAALFASEAAIYGRFGYGMACEHYSFTVNRGDGRIRPPAAAGSGAGSGEPSQGGTTGTGVRARLSLKLAEPKTARADLMAVYNAVRATRPGMITRSDGWWDLSLSDPEFMRDGSTPLGCVIAGDSSGARGYALYSTRGGWDSDGIPDQVLSVRELLGTDSAALAALWADILSRDLVGKVRARMRPVDDPLPHLLSDPRRARAGVSDGLWIRLVDLPEALRRRRYAAGVDVVIEVADPLLPANHGRWRLSSAHGSAATPACERTADEADLAMPVSALGAAYLGGTRLGALAAAGQVTELRPGALAELSAAMWWDPAPWSPVMF